MGDGGRELRGIEHDGVEAAALLQEAPQGGVHVGIEEFRAGGLEAVEDRMRTRSLQRRPRRIDGGHLRGSARERRDGEAAGVAIAVEHLARAEPAHGLGKAVAAIALVEVEAGLVAFGDVQGEAPAMFADGQLRGAIAAQPPRGGLQALQLPHAGIGAFVEPGEAGGLQQGVGDHGFPALGAGAGELRHQGVAVAVHDQAGQAVGLPVHQAHAVAVDREALPRPDRAVHGRGEECGVDALRLVEAPGAGADARCGAEGGPRQEAAVRRLHPHGLPAVAAALGNGRFEDPGMAAQEGTLLARAQADGFHGPYCPSASRNGAGTGAAVAQRVAGSTVAARGAG